MEKYSKLFTDCNGNSRQVVWWRIKGNRPGPVLTLVAGQHGMEHVGPAILPEFAEEIEQLGFGGEVRICANANPFALAMDYEFYPEHEDLSKIKDYYYSIFRHNYCPWGLGRDIAQTMYNMNRLWNRKEIHGVAGEVTAWLWKEMIPGSHVVLDMHCHQGTALIYSGEGTNFQLASMPGIKVLAMEDPKPGDWDSGNLNFQAKKAGIETLCFEFPIQHARGEFCYEKGKRYLRNVMIGCRMMDGKIIHDNPVWKIPYDPEADRKSIVRADAEGRLRFFKKVYDPVKKGDLIFTLRSVETGEVIQEGRALRDGIVGRSSIAPIVHKGDFCTYVPIAELLVPAGTEVAKFEENWWKK